VDTILSLAGIGFLLMLTEMFLPGGVLGALGGLMLVAAVIVGYVKLGAFGGTIVLCVVLVCGLVGFCVAMAIFPRTTVGRKMTLGQTSSDGGGLTSVLPAVGSEGIALTLLRPAGKALIDGRRIDVVAEGEFIEAQQPVVVIAADGLSVAVRKKA
jgi:membrane-bound serine protease (ClpP class)